MNSRRRKRSRTLACGGNNSGPAVAPVVVLEQSIEVWHQGGLVCFEFDARTGVISAPICDTFFLDQEITATYTYNPEPQMRQQHFDFGDD